MHVTMATMKGIWRSLPMLLVACLMMHVTSGVELRAGQRHRIHSLFREELRTKARHSSTLHLGEESMSESAAAAAARQKVHLEAKEFHALLESMVPNGQFCSTSPRPMQSQQQQHFQQQQPNFPLPGPSANQYQQQQQPEAPVTPHITEQVEDQHPCQAREGESMVYSICPQDFRKEAVTAKYPIAPGPLHPMRAHRRKEQQAKPMTPEQVSQGVKPVRIDLFMMGICPDAKRFIDAFKPILSMLACFLDLHVWMIANVNTLTKYGYYSMHGDPEVLADLNHLCGQEYYRDKYRFMAWIWAQMQNLNSMPSEAAATARVLNIDMDKIESCVGKGAEEGFGQEGHRLMDMSIQDDMLKGVNDSPTVLINGQYWTIGTSKQIEAADKSRYYDMDQLMLDICDHYEGIKPGRCEEWEQKFKGKVPKKEWKV